MSKLESASLGLQVKVVLGHSSSRAAHARRIVNRLRKGVIAAHGEAAMELAAQPHLQAIINGSRAGSLISEGQGILQARSGLRW